MTKAYGHTGEREKGLPRDKQIEVEAAQLEDGIVSAKAGVAKKKEGEELCGELEAGCAVEDDGED